MAKKIVKKCSKCGVVVKSYYHESFCKSCADEVWDAGFESTSQHADEQHESLLKEVKEINEFLSHPPVNYDSLKEIIKYNNGTFHCKNCQKLRLDWKWPGDDEKKAKLKEMLNTKCPKCGDIGNFKFVW